MEYSKAMVHEIKKFMYVYPEDMSYQDRQDLVSVILDKFEDVYISRTSYSHVVFETHNEKYQIRELINKYAKEH